EAFCHGLDLQLLHLLCKFARVEWREIIELFTGADKARWNFEFILDRNNDSALAAAIEFGDDQAAEPNGALKLARLAERVAASGCIDHEQRLVRRIRIEFAERAFHLLQVGHGIVFGVLTTGRIAK